MGNRIHAPLLALALSCLFLTGCGSESGLTTAALDPSADATGSIRMPPALDSEPRSRRALYPLVIGNRWRHEGTSFARQGDVSKQGRWVREAVLTRWVTRFGRSYLEENITLTQPDQQVQLVRWLREDESGLYESGVASIGAPPDQEQRLLAYPLHRGARWLMSEMPRISAEVEGMEVRETPEGRIPSWRIRIHHAGHAAGEQEYVWYGRAGYLGMKRHLESSRPGPDGAPITTVANEAEWLTGLHLTPTDNVSTR